MAQSAFSFEKLEHRTLFSSNTAVAPEVYLPRVYSETAYQHQSTPAVPTTGPVHSVIDELEIHGPALQTPPSTAPAFRVFDALAYENMPQLGFEKIMVTAELWQKTRTGNILDVPYEPAVRAVARRAAELNQVLVFDVEHWDTDTRRVTPEQFEANLSKLIQIVDWARDEAPSIQLGFYGIMPTHDLNVGRLYYDGIRSGKPQLYQWLVDDLTRNSEKLRPLADKVDFIFPSMYMEGTSIQGWLDNAAVMAEISKIYGKPVIPFFRADYAPRVDKSEPPLPLDIIRTHLEFIEQHFDGVVLWGGMELYNGRWRHEDWDTHGARWWPTATDILGEHLLSDLGD